MLGSVKKELRYYLSITDGKLSHTDQAGEKEYYSYMEGYLENIYKLDRTIKGALLTFWYIDVRGEDGTLYSLSLPYKSGVFKSIALCLASVPRFDSPVKIEPYYKDGFSKVTVSKDGSRLDWVSKELPEIKTVTVGDQTIKDDSERMSYISSLVDKINDNILLTSVTIKQ